LDNDSSADVKIPPPAPLLRGNAPNPFHATTTIHYTLAQTMKVQIVVRDLLGTVVATLVDGEQAAGDHVAIFNGAAYVPGLYYYTISHEEEELQHGTMVLVK